MFRMAKIACYHLSYFKENRRPSRPAALGSVTVGALNHPHPLLQRRISWAVQVHVDTCLDVQRVRRIQAVLGVLVRALSLAGELMRRSVLYHSSTMMAPGQGWY